MKDLQIFIDKARKIYDALPFIEEYINNKLVREVKATFLYNQSLIISSIENISSELTKDFPEVLIQHNLNAAWKQEWPYEADDVSKPWVQPSMMYATQNWVEHINTIKDIPHKLISHLYATHSEIHKHQKSSVLYEKLETKFNEYYKDHKDEMLVEVKVAWDFKQSLVWDLEAHKEMMDEVLPRINLFKVAAKEIMDDKSGLNDMSAGNRDETEDMKVRAELMKNAVTMREMDLDDVPEAYKDYVKEDLAQEEKKRKETDKKFEDAPKR